MQTRDTEAQCGSETIFSPHYRDIWINIIFPYLENKKEYCNDDKKLKDIWQMAHTCKSARTFALQYLAKRYEKDTLELLENHYNKDIGRISARKRLWPSLFVAIQMDSCASFILETLRALSFIAIGVPIAIDHQARMDSTEPDISTAKIMFALIAIFLALSLLIAANNYHDRLEHNSRVDKELAYPLKRRDQVIRQRLTLFPETQKPTIIETIKKSCNIQ